MWSKDIEACNSDKNFSLAVVHYWKKKKVKSLPLEMKEWGGKEMEMMSSENVDPFKRLKTTGNDNDVGPVFFFLFNSLKDNCLFKKDNTSWPVCGG